jgi:hypothetical protein
MAKGKQAAKKKSGKADKAATAAEMRELEAKAKEEKTLEHVTIIESKRPLEEILKDRVEILPNHLGLKLAEDTPLEENLRILDWTTTLSNHVGFMIGDVLNFGKHKFGEMYTVALNQTGRALSTLKGYAEAARRIPPEKRVASLSFTLHREILRLPDEKVESVLKQVGAKADKGEAPTTSELRAKLKELAPRKPKRAVSGKAKPRKGRPELPVYEPTPDEQQRLDDAELAIDEAAETLKSGKVFAVLARLSNKDKKRWLDKLHGFVVFYNNLDKATGNY